MKNRALLASALFLAACGGGGSGSPAPAPSPTPTPAPVVTIAITPTTVDLAGGAAQQFACTVTGAADNSCTWRVEETDGGTVAADGRYTAPMTAGTYHVVATSTADTGKTASATVRVTIAAAASPWVTGYYLGYFWDAMYPPERVDMTAMTHFAFGRTAPGSGTLGGNPGAVVEGAGTAHDPGLSPDGVRSVEDYLVKRAHDAGRKALVMLGGEGDGNGFLRSTADATRPVFVRNLVDYLVAHDYDGVDVDWEDKLEGSSEITPAVSAVEARRRVIALLRELRTEAATRPRYQGAGRGLVITFPGYTLSINDLPPDGRVEQWQADIANLVDQYNLMSYGIGTAWNQAGWHSWFSSPIFGASGTTPRDLATSVAAFERSGVPRSRIGIGIGFYGIFYGPTITGPRQDTEHNDIFEVQDVPLRYSELVRLGYLSNGTYHWDAISQVGYRSYANGGFAPPGSGIRPAGFLSYEDAQSIAAKAAWVRQTGVGGAILWAINYDHMPDGTSPLLAAVKQSFQPTPP